MVLPLPLPSSLVKNKLQPQVDDEFLYSDWVLNLSKHFFPNKSLSHQHRTV